jgi:hypothetical protein
MQGSSEDTQATRPLPETVAGDGVSHAAESAPPDVPPVSEAPHPALTSKATTPEMSANAAAREPEPPEPLPVKVATAPASLALPHDSGLVLVETRFQAPPPEEQQAEAQRPRRARPVRVSLPDEPLQIVETRKRDGA